jgi:predicted NACHT family NTPase
MFKNFKSEITKSNLDKFEKDALLDIVSNSEPIKISKKLTKCSAIYEVENIYIFIKTSIFRRNIIVDYYIH